MRNTTSIVVGVIVIILIIIGLAYLGSKPNNQFMTNTTNTASTTPFSLTSTAFADGTSIPKEFTCEGGNYNPPLTINNPPQGTVSFALTMFDPDVPKQVRPEGFFDHWVIFNIPATTTDIAASSTVGVLGNNGANIHAYTGPCPPTQYEPREHRYIFTLYALDSELSLLPGSTRAQVEQAVIGHVLEQTQLTGRYQKVATTTATSTGQ